MQEQEQHGAQADDAPGGQDAVDSRLVISGGRVEVVEDDREDQQRPPEETGQPLITQIEKTLGRVLRALAGLARSIAGGGHCRNYPAPL